MDSGARRGSTNRCFGDVADSGGAVRRRNIEVVQTVVGFLEEMDHRIDKFSHMQVRFFLLAVAEHFEFRRIALEFFQKVVNRAMRRPLPVYPSLWPKGIGPAAAGPHDPPLAPPPAL